MRISAPILVSAALLSAAPFAPMTAQGLDRVEELARVGRTEEARDMLLEWWDAASDAASQRDLQRGLWLRGRLTVDPNQAELDFQRLVVLYPSSPYAPQALLRLAQSAHAHGDGAGAARHVTSIERDYPTSPVRADADEWRRSAGAPPPPVEAPRTPMAPAPAPAATAAANPPGTGIRPSSGRPPAPADEVLEWSVQFGAFTDQDRAFALHQELVSAGLTARLVSVAGSGFTHVRIGRFSNRADASTQLQQVTTRGFTAAIVRDGRAEEVVRR